MSDDLESILNGEEAPEPVRDDSGKFAAEAPEVEAEPAEVETEDVVEATGETEDAGSPPAEEEDKNASEVAGLKAEIVRQKDRRKAAEAQLQQQNAQPEPKPDFFEDPDAALNTLESRFDAKLQKARIDWSEQAARESHEDFDEKISHFMELANENPAMWMQMNQQANPAEWAYKTATNAIKMADIGDISSFEEKVRAEERAKVEAESTARIEAEIKKRMNLPGSLSDTRASGGNTAPPVGNETLDDVIGEDASHRR